MSVAAHLHLHIDVALLGSEHGAQPDQAQAQAERDTVTAGHGLQLSDSVQSNIV